MVVEVAPAAALVGPKPEFLLELLVVPLDAPPELGEFDQAREADVLGQGREPVLGGFLLAFRPLDHEPFLRAQLIAPVIAMSGSHPHPSGPRGEAIGQPPPPCEAAGWPGRHPPPPGDPRPRPRPKTKPQPLNRDWLVVPFPGEPLW